MLKASSSPCGSGVAKDPPIEEPTCTISISANFIQGQTCNFDRTAGIYIEIYLRPMCNFLFRTGQMHRDAYDNKANNDLCRCSKTWSRMNLYAMETAKGNFNNFNNFNNFII